MKETSLVSLNVLNFNTFDKTKICIDSCLKQKGISYKVILIDNSSTDDSFERLHAHYGERILYLRNEANYGYAKGNNLGVRYSADIGIKYSLLLNSDTELVGEHLVSSLVDVMEQNTNCAVVAPTIYDVTKDGLLLHTNDSFYLKILRVFGILPKNKRINSSLVSVSEAHGSALLIENNEFLKVKGFPEHYFMYCEESTFAKKILWSNKTILWKFDADKYILHHHDKSSSVSNWRLYLMGRNRGLEYWENHGKFALSWPFVYYLFTLKCWIASIITNNWAYFDGLRSSKSIVYSHLSSDECFMKAKHIMESYK